MCPTTTNLTRAENGDVENEIWLMVTNQKMKAMTECKQPCSKLSAKINTKYYAKARKSEVFVLDLLKLVISKDKGNPVYCIFLDLFTIKKVLY